MAMMNVEIISKEIIKPSSPTPHDLRNTKRSFLDQLAPTSSIPIILFYQPKNGHHVDDNQVQTSSRLKRSLEQTLNRFYPFAGSIKEEHSIDCNDEGVEYYEARVVGKLSQVLEHYNAEILNQFLPFDPYESHEVLLAVQYNMFDCGGVAIGVCVSHRIADGDTATTFLRTWSATSREYHVLEAICPKFDAATYFPPKDIFWGLGDMGVTKENIVTRRLVFDKSSIAALKEKASSSAGCSQVRFPTRVEVVSAFIWKSLMAISKSKPAPARVHAAVHAVNIRQRMVPPMPIHSFGNLWYFATAILSPHDELDRDSNYGILVSKLSNALKEIDGDYVKTLQTDAIPESLTNSVELFSEGDLEFYKFTSWCRFPLYEADFGSGEPTWVCRPSMPFKNLVVLMSTKDGHGIEAFVNILEEDAVVFDSDEELLPFVSWTIN
ncbi:stemmadenine O-acetyltransferase-like isoform X1 [Alnus glutinosa]|uniref:stemmadenine O-acetyltransferase-like isoform X1 n=1 Tax=Alnus glutinosa TaxID=3517 RepID=UPI002D78FD3E|nr:stemmadenine O-acetyltransferase-like isoform X1 [Alnus glutinosa]